MDILILGSGIAAVSAAQAARKENSQAKITIYTDDKNLPYYRLRLLELVADSANKEKLFLHPASWYEDQDIALVQGHKARELLAEDKKVLFENGLSASYDRLILATGSSSFVPPIEGKELPGIYTLWTMDDAHILEKAAESSKHAVVVGGGVLGLETAHVLAGRGLEVALIDRTPILMNRQLDKQGAELFTRMVEKLGIQFIGSANTNAFVAGKDGRVSQVLLDDGKSIEADMVVVSTGVYANTAFIKPGTLRIDRKIEVNRSMQTSDPSVYAAGDVASVEKSWYGLWQVSMAQGKVAGTNAAGGNATYEPKVPPYRVATMGTQIVSAGVYDEEVIRRDYPEKADFFESEVVEDEAHGIYRKLTYCDGNLCGYILIGDVKDQVKLQKDLKPVLHA